jgi:hypothetical protein
LPSQTLTQVNGAVGEEGEESTANEEEEEEGGFLGFVKWLS